MAIKLSSYIAAPPDIVIRVLCSQAYNEAHQRDREDNVSARYALLEEEGGRPTRYDLHVISYKRKKTGALDRSRTEGSVVHYEYSPASGALRWRYEGEDYGDRVRVYGVTRISAEGRGARVEREVTIDIRVPVIGRGIAKLVGKKLEEGLHHTQGLLRQMALEEATGSKTP